MKANVIFALFSMIVLLGIGTAGASAITTVTLSSNLSSTTYFNQPILLTATVSGGSGNYIYTYTIGGKEIPLSPYTTISPNSIIFTNGNPYGVSGPTTFSVQVADASNTPDTVTANTIVTIDTSNSNSIIVTATSTSAKVDVGQTIPITVSSVSGGTAPYNLTLYSGYSPTCSSDSNSGLTDLNSIPYTFNEAAPHNVGNGTTVYYCIKATDSKSYTSYSSTIPVIVYNAIGGAISGISSGIGYYTNMDVGQSQIFTATPTGGTGSYYYDWTLGNSITVSGSGEFQTFSSPIMDTPGNYLLTLKISDTGTQYGTTPAEQPNVILPGGYINVYPFSVTLSAVNKSVDQGQSETLTANVYGGSGVGYNYVFYYNLLPIGNVITTNKSASITFNAIDGGAQAYTVGVYDMGALKALGNYTENKTNVVIYPGILINQYVNEPVKMDIGQNVKNAGSVSILSGGSGSFITSNTLLYNGNSIPYNSVFASNGTFTPNMPGIYNATFTIRDTKTGYTLIRSFNSTVYAAPIISYSISNAIYLDNQWQTDAGQNITFNVKSIGGTGANITAYISCAPNSFDKLVDCYLSPFISSSSVYSARVLLSDKNSFSNTITLQTINSPASKYSFNISYSDLGASFFATPYEIFSQNVIITTVPPLSDIQTPTVSNAVIDQGQSSNMIVNFGTAQGGLLPFNWNWIYNINSSKYAISNSCPTGSIQNTSFSNAETYCMFNTNTITDTGTYQFELNTTDSANYSAMTNPVSIRLNKALGITAIATNSVMDIGQTDLLSNKTTGGTLPYSYQWSVETPGSSTFVNISGAVTPTYLFAPVGNAIGIYNFELTVKDHASTPVIKTSAPITVTVNPDPTVSITPATNTIMDVGQSVKFTATSTSGTGLPSTYKYQWYIISGTTNTPISGATSSTYLYTPASNTVISIGVIVTDDANFNVNSTNVANIIVYNMQKISVSIPSNTYLDVGQSTVLSSLVTEGTGSYSYLWTISPPGSTLPMCPGLTSDNTNTITYTPSSSGLGCIIQVAVTDTGTSSYATPQSVVTGIFNSITIYPTPTLSDLTPSNAIIDLGQSETFNVIINGGSNRDMSLALYASPQNYIINYVTGAGDGVQTFPNFVPNSIENTFYVNGLDSGTTTLFDIAPSSFSTITINSAPTSTVSATNNSIYANQESTLTSNIIGGTPGYTYQWYIETPGSSTFNAIPNANKPTFVFNLSTMTTGGTYNFRLVTTDSASTPETFNSTNIVSVNVNNKFTNNMLVLNVNAKIINDPDSGNFGYWALDNISRNIIVWQTAIPSGPLVANSYIANIIDTGISSTFAGAISPGAGLKEPNNGIANMIGSEELSFNGTFTPGSNTVSITGQSIGTLNNNGNAAFILLGTYAKQTAPIQSTFKYYLDKYFTITNGYTNGVTWLNWGDTYNYNVYPPSGQIMTDNSISTPSITGDIVTYTQPTVTLSQPSATVLDNGQSVTYSATVYNGIGSFSIELLQNGNVIQTNTIAPNGLGNVVGNTITYVITPPIGTDTYEVIGKDLNASNFEFNSIANTITVYSDPSVITNVITPVTMDIGQHIPVSVSVNGGTGKFSYLWTVASGTKPASSCPGFTSSTSNVFIYTPTSTTANCNFEITVKDIGVSAGAVPVTPYTVYAASAGPITVYANLTKVTLSPLNTTMNIGQTQTFMANVFGGTSPSNYVYTWYDNGNVIKSMSCATATCVYSPKISGAKNITINVRDSGTTTPPAEPSANVSASTTIMVYNALGMTTIPPSNSILDLGQHITYTAIPTGGTGNYIYQWYNSTSGTPIIISGATANTYTFNADSPSIVSTYSATEKLYNGSSMSYSPFTVTLNQMKPPGYPFDEYMSISIAYNGNTLQSSVIFLPVGGTYQYTVPGTSNTLNISVTNITSDSNGLYAEMKLGIPITTYYSYFASVTDIGTSNTVVSSETSNSGMSSAYVNNALIFTYNRNQNIVTDAGFGFGGDVGMSFINGTAPYSILGINSTTDSLPEKNGVQLCDSYAIMFQPSCSFGVAVNAIPGNYVIPISASDSSSGQPTTNVIDNINVQVNPDVNAIGTGFISNVILDPTQMYSYTMNAFNGTLPYTYGWDISYIETLHFGSFTFNELNAEAPSLFSNITVLNGCGGTGIFGSGMGIANDTCSFIADNATNGSVKFTGVVTDNAMFGGAFTPPFGKAVFNSNITIENVPVITVTPSNSLLDQNQYEIYTISVTGGAGPFNVNFYNTTSGKEKLISTFTIASGSSNTVTFQATNIGTFSYNAVATDMGTTSPYTFNSSTSTISVNNPLIKVNLNLHSGRYYDQGNAVDFEVLNKNGVTGGTQPYSYDYTARNYNTNAVLVNSGLANAEFAFTATQIGTFYGNVTVVDNATSPETVTSTNNAMFIVNPDIGPLSINVSNLTIPLGNSEIFTSNIIGGGGTVPYIYTYNIYNATTNKLVYTTSTSPTTSTSNSIIYTPTVKGYYYVKVTVYDNASTVNYKNSGESYIFLVGNANAIAPTAFISPNSNVFGPNGAAEYDSGQTIGYNVEIFGGIGPFNVTLYNVTGNNVYSKQSNVPGNVLGGPVSTTFTIPANTLNSVELTYNVIVTDNGALPSVTFNSIDSNIIVNPALGSNVTLSNSTIDMGQSTIITVNMRGGTPPYNFTYIVNGNTIYTASGVSSTGSNDLVPTINSYATTWNTLSNVGGISSLGVYTVNVLIKDKVGSNETLSNTITVNNVLMPATLTLSSNTLTDGSTLTMYASNVIGGTSPYSYDFEIFNKSSNTLISNSGYQAGNSTPILITSAMNGADYGIVLVKDNAGMISTSNSELFSANSAPSTPPTGGGGGGGGAGGGGGSGGTPAKKTIPNIFVANTLNSNVTIAVGNAIKIEAFNTTNIDSITEIVANRVLENYSGSLSSGLTYINYTFVPQIGKYNITAISVSGNQRSIMLDVVKTINASALVPGNSIGTNSLSTNTLNGTKLGIPSNTVNTTNNTRLKPTLLFTKECSSYNFTENKSCTTTAKIVTQNNVLEGTLYLNGNFVGTTNSTISNTVSKMGIYKYVFSTNGNGNYINTSLNYAFTIYGAAATMNKTNTSTPASGSISIGLIALVILIILVLLWAYHYMSKSKSGMKKNNHKK